MTTPIAYQPRQSGTAGLITQTLAMLLDAYRELQSRRLFWITMVLSAVVVAAFAAVGFDETGFSIFGKHIASTFINTRFVPRDELYRSLFVNLGVQWWLSWLGIILALVSTAPMFPEFLTGGAVDLYLARPMSRTRLLMTKYVAGLIFTALQVTVFCAASFLVLGIRGGAWVPGLFVAVPLVTMLFSYLWAVCTLVSLVTRSTIAALLLTILFWFLCFGLHTAETTLLFFKVGQGVELREIERVTAINDKTISSLTTRPAATRPGSSETSRIASAQRANEELATRKAELAKSSLAQWHTAFYALNYPMPKTAETSALVERTLIKQFRARPGRNREGDEEDKDAPVKGFLRNPRLEMEATTELAKIIRGRSLGYILGTSLGFEVVILGLCLVIFTRRDF